MSEASLQNDETRRPTWREAAVRSAACSALFIGLYGITNYLASLRPDVGSFHFGWEMSLPLVPVMIVPYMSIDLFFVSSFFLCTERREMVLLTKRLVAAMFIASFFFVVVPQKVAFVRTAVPGFWGPAFAFLYSFDMPYNLAPSLHIAFRSILWFVYTRHTRGLLNGLLRVWFILIGVSTILTHQHHVLDIFSGQLLAMFCFYVLPTPASGPAMEPRRVYSRRLSRIYAAAALALGVAGAALLPWGALLFWPAFSLAMMSMAYGGVGPGIFRKSDGRLPLSARLWLGPYLLGARLSSRYFLRGVSPFTQIAPGLYLGGRVAEHDMAALRGAGVRSVVDLTAEYGAPASALSMNYLNVAVLDLTAPTAAQLAAACEYIDHHKESGAAYVHCALGLGRGACVAAAYLLHRGSQPDVDAAIEAVRAVRPGVVIRADAKASLAEFAANLRTRIGDAKTPVKPQ